MKMDSMSNFVNMTMIMMEKKMMRTSVVEKGYSIESILIVQAMKICLTMKRKNLRVNLMIPIRIIVMQLVMTQY